MASISITKVEISDEYGNVIGSPITDIPEPSGYEWGKMDISGQEAGRRLTSDMWKNMVAQARTLDLTWTNRSSADVSKAFSAFDHEYMWVTYFDIRTNKYERKHFYGGDMTASVYSWNAPSGKILSVAKTKLIQAITDKV